MKFILRVTGTWFIGLALVLLIIDGAKTLAANALTMTSLAENWSSLDAASWLATNKALADLLPGTASSGVFTFMSNAPSWAIFGIAGLLLLLIGRPGVKKRYVATY